MRVNIYIRKENEAKWADIEDKSAWVNEMLNPMSFKTLKPILVDAAKQASKAQEETIQKANDKLAIDAFNGKTTIVSGMNTDSPSSGTLTCKYGHYSRDGKSCNNIKCAYFNV